NIGFGGLKDKQAITTQFFSLRKISVQAVKQLKIPGTEIISIGTSAKPIFIGAHEGNKFRIVIRDIDEQPLMPKILINLFGEQRFSTNNAEIGRCIVKKDFKTAAKLASEQHACVRESLANNLADAVGALHSIPRKILQIYISAFQSLLWNRAALVCATKKHKETLPLPGFSMQEEECICAVMQQEKLTSRDFVIPQIPELSAEGGERSLFLDSQNLRINSLELDELHIGRKKCILEFTLQKGAYATEVVRQMFSISKECL
ncbi:MAG: tRNA pseudouridine(13) synthase TruD, partial [Candidatus Woesearchaeota archaeon]|nr:tRNA pseudouridine(13) synthase TruD [Candidatus Woesearchaeota archaeon]